MIVGGGIVGMCLAWFLAEEGHDVAVVDDGRHAGTIANAGGLHVQLQSRFMRLYPEMVPAFEETLPFYPRAVRHWQALAAAPRRGHRARRHRRPDGGGEPRAVRVPGEEVPARAAARPGGRDAGSRRARPHRALLRAEHRRRRTVRHRGQGQSAARQPGHPAQGAGGRRRALHGDARQRPRPRRRTASRSRPAAARSAPAASSSPPAPAPARWPAISASKCRRAPSRCT